jgi:regulator of CtrA degradation
VSGGGLVETTFFSRTYDEALALVVEARDYLANNLATDRSGASFGDRLIYDCETLRLTTRLTQVMAWLFIQRAVHEGEISADEAKQEECRLGGREICLDNDPDMLAALPAHFGTLMERSLKLYQRIARLDEMVQRHGP